MDDKCPVTGMDAGKLPDDALPEFQAEIDKRRREYDERFALRAEVERLRAELAEYRRDYVLPEGRIVTLAEAMKYARGGKFFVEFTATHDMERADLDTMKVLADEVERLRARLKCGSQTASHTGGRNVDS